LANYIQGKLIAIKGRLNKLKAAGLLERIDGKKGGYWKVIKQI
jgi:hypothetical protein